MAAPTPFRVAFALGTLGVLGSVVVGAASHWRDSGRLPPYRANPLELLPPGPGDRIAEYRMYAALQPRDARAHAQLGAALARAGRRRQAVAALEEALALRPVPGGVHAQLVPLYLRSGRVGDAREQARAALEKGADVSPALLTRLGLARASP